ncbi:universal stress protein UspA [Rickettsiella grylli]|uniref:universal stress protein n=1 Tax=Rickettsiella grylli TaxID=59196 RepID=UPI0008FCEE7B|nr:universal stress protein [Rickettsiella grylli]OIZ98473.1 universal stress protein UspA [Rickettsiella grylli]
MSIYKNILVAIDLHPTCDEIILKRAHAFVKEGQGRLSVIHAVEHINAYGVAQAYPAVIDLEGEMLSEAKKQLADVSKKFDIPVKQQYVEVGSPKIVILDKMKQLKTDLIIIGSHGRHGIGILFGSTASAVIHHLSCDALVVKIPELKA